MTGGATPRRARAVVALLYGWVAILGVAACGSDPKPRPVVPDGFDVPKGVRITDGGAKRQLGKPATVVYQIEQRAASAVTVTVTSVVQGDLARDFQFFNLPEEVKTSTPLYVHLHVRNEGPSGLGGVALPVLLRTASNKVFPPNDLVGDFRPCPHPALPASFLAGSVADLCLVFLVPEGQKAKSIDVQTGEPRDAIHYLVTQT
ncbi:MAG TPA: hypothetical protein VM093_06995 [Aeromicrobium sp.]|nr:hypothetical protein [Aeromicrobium sp.]